MDLVATPDRLIRTQTSHSRPSGVDWDALSADRHEEIPVLEQFAPE
jgi:5-formyltetrahydrofolate cyclo-ligase